MDDISQLEECYKKYIKDISAWIPEGMIDVDLKLMQRMGLLNYHRKEKSDPMLTRFFHVIETPEKITLVNDHFIVWIVPEKIDQTPITYILIAINKLNEPHLELALSISGVYNTSRLVLKVLEAYLQEIQETQDLLEKLAKAS